MCCLTFIRPPRVTIPTVVHSHTGWSWDIWHKQHINSSSRSHQSTIAYTRPCCSLRHQLRQGIVSIKSISCRESNQVDEFTVGIIIPTAKHLRAINHGKSQEKSLLFNLISLSWWTAALQQITEVKKITMRFILADKKSRTWNNISFT